MLTQIGEMIRMGGKGRIASWDNLEDNAFEQKQRSTRAMGAVGIGMSIPIPA